MTHCRHALSDPVNCSVRVPTMTPGAEHVTQWVLAALEVTAHEVPCMTPRWICWPTSTRVGCSTTRPIGTPSRPAWPKVRSRLYYGCDPTADSLHHGQPDRADHAAALPGRRAHRPIALAGGATGMVGDPSGRSEERNLLDDATLRPQRRRHQGARSAASSTSTGPTTVGSSTTATGPQPISLLEFLRDVGKHATVNQMLAQESVKVRLESEQRHLLHRVQLHAAAGQRLPAGCTSTSAASCRSAARTSGATSCPAST